MSPRSAKTQTHELHRSLGPRSSLSRANPGRIPANRIPGSHLSYPANKPSNLTAIPAKGPNHPLGDSIQIIWGLGGYTRWVRSRTPSGESKYHPGDSLRITQGLGGYTRRVCSRAPSGESKYPRVILSESPGGSGATPVGCTRSHPLESENTPWEILSKSPRGSGATVGDLILGYPMR